MSMLNDNGRPPSEAAIIIAKSLNRSILASIHHKNPPFYGRFNDMGHILGK